MATTATGSDSVTTATGGSTQGVSSSAVGSSLRRLNPVDGLFLRAEHLDQIQDHAAELVRLTAGAGGSGVVYGFTLDLDGERLGSSAGLAVDPAGELLRSPRRIEVDLHDLAHDTGRVWVIEVVAAEPVRTGREPLYSAVCADPCGPESAVQPWIESAVRLQVRPETLAVDTDPEHRVSAVASAWFDRERREGDPWLTPPAPGAAIGHLADRPWSVASPADAPGAAGVPLGVLIRMADSWYLDTWIARRDRALEPASAAWQRRLGRRPEPVFTAQVLQFQDQLARGRVEPDHPLTDRFVELPPAGFLPMPALAEETSVEEWLNQVFGFSVGLQVIRCTADTAYGAVELAGDLDRTPLRRFGSDDPERRPGLLVLVPTVPADLPAVRTDRYPWLAFVRLPRLGSQDDPRILQVPQVDPLPEPEPDDAPAEADPVRVFVADAPRLRADYHRATRAVVTGDVLAEVRFARSGWRPELDADTVERIRSAVGTEYTDVDLVVTTADTEREPLATARARALAGDLGLGTDAADRTVGIYSAQLDGPDLVVLMVRRKR